MTNQDLCIDMKTILFRLQVLAIGNSDQLLAWIPAFAGMTEKGVIQVASIFDLTI
jgi:hypothetical protein